MKIKYIKADILYECFLDYENITNICNGCDSQNHTFDSCSFNTKSVAFRIERVQEPSQVDKSQGLRD